MLPSETLLDIISCLCYKTLVAARLANSCFLRVYQQNAKELPHQRTFRLNYCFEGLYVYEWRNGRIRDFGGYQSESYIRRDAFEEANKVVGVHQLDEALFQTDDFQFNIAKFIQWLPAIQFTKSLHLSEYGGDSSAMMALLERFTTLEKLYMSPTARNFDWTLLRTETFLCLKRLTLFCNRHSEPFDQALAEDEVLRYCQNMKCADSESLRVVWFHGWTLSETFVHRALKVVADCTGRLAVIFSCNDKLDLSTEGFTASYYKENYGGNDTITYASRNANVRVLVERSRYDESPPFRMTVTNDAQYASVVQILEAPK